jgi:hypothetical protein
LAYFAVVDTASSDPALTLLVSQSIIENQTVNLDAYKNVVEHRYHFDYNYRIENKNGHYYYLYPIGTPILSVPFVWIARLLGKDMVIHENEYALQNILSAFLCALIFIIIL